MESPILSSLAALAARVPDGAKLAVPTDYSGVAMAATFALLRRGIKGLHLVCVPASGIQAELLIGAGAVTTLETSAITLGELGPAPCFVDAVKRGSIRLLDATCPAIHAALQAAEKGLPFMPLRGLIGSDLLKFRADWKIIENPFDARERLVAIPALAPDVALFHAPLADREGNVWVGRRRELVVMAHAAKETLVTVEEVREESLFEDEALTAGILPALYVSAVAEAKRGAWPLGLWDAYGDDEAALERYVAAAREEDGFRRILASWLARPQAAAAE
ncbi:MAG: CoA transferase subunit A [Alphaproteobacteria bacterium]